MITTNAIVTTLAGGGASGSQLGYIDGSGSSVLFSFPHGISTNSWGTLVAVADKGNNLVRTISTRPCSHPIVAEWRGDGRTWTCNNTLGWTSSPVFSQNSCGVPDCDTEGRAGSFVTYPGAIASSFVQAGLWKITPISPAIGNLFYDGGIPALVAPTASIAYGSWYCTTTTVATVTVVAASGGTSGATLRAFGAICPRDAVVASYATGVIPSGCTFWVSLTSQSPLTAVYAQYNFTVSGGGISASDAFCFVLGNNGPASGNTAISRVTFVAPGPTPTPSVTPSATPSIATAPTRTSSPTPSFISPSALSLSVPVIVTTLAGNLTRGWADGTGTSARFNNPTGVAISSTGVIYVADSSNNLIRAITPSGLVTSLAGTTTTGTNDGSGATARFNSPYSIVADKSGLMFVSDIFNHRIRVVTTAGVVTTLAGGVMGGSEGSGSNAGFNYPRGLIADDRGGVYVADADNNRIRWVSSAGAVTTFLGSTPGSMNGVGANALFYRPLCIATSGGGVLFIADKNHKVRAATPSGVVTSFVGGGASGNASGFLDGTGSNALFDFPSGIVVASSGILFVADNFNHKIRMITTGAIVTTLAGGGASGSQFGYSDGSGTMVLFNQPYALSINPSGTLLVVADYINSLVRTISTRPCSHPIVAEWRGDGRTWTCNNTLGWTSSPVFSQNFCGVPDCDNEGRAGSFITYPGAIASSFVQVGQWKITPISPTIGTLFYDGGVPALVAPTASVAYGSWYCTTSAVASVTVVAASGGTSGATLLAYGGTCPRDAVIASYATGVIPSGCTSWTSLTPQSPLTDEYAQNNFTVSGGEINASSAFCFVLGIKDRLGPAAGYTAISRVTFVATGPTPTPSVSPSATPSYGTAPTLSQTPALTPSSTSPPSPSGTPTPSPSPTLTSTATPTPTTSPPPQSCLSRVEGCSTPTLVFQPPLFTSGLSLPLPLPPLPMVSYPFLSTPFNVSLPRPPTAGETLAITCTLSAGNEGAVEVVAMGGVVEGGGGRVVVSPWGASFILRGTSFPSSTFLSPPTFPTTTVLLQCLVTSTPITGIATFPRYGKSTLLTSPVVVVPTLPPPTLAFVLAESGVGRGTGGGGVFRGLGGVVGEQYPLSFFNAGTAEANTSTTTTSVGGNSSSLKWDASIIPSLPSAITALYTLRDALFSVPSLSSSSTTSLTSPPPPPPFMATISGVSHLLLFSPPTQPFPAQLTVSLGGFPCRLNWVSPDATIASVTTPLGMGDFGIAPLCLWGGGGEASLYPHLQNYSAAAVAALSTSSISFSTSTSSTFPSLLPPLSFPSLYPPLMPTGKGGTMWGNATPTSPTTTLLILAPFQGMVNGSLLSRAAAAATLPPNTFGIRVVEACSGNPYFAPPEACVVVNGTLQPYLNTSSLMTCAWGSGDSCQPCPMGALCPGGRVLIPTPGYWVPSLSSPIEDFFPCPQPAPEVRCPAVVAGGGGGISTTTTTSAAYSACGLGYRGRACAVCDVAFYEAPDGTCARCPGISATLGILLPFLYLILGLGGLGCVLVVLLQWVLVRRWRRVVAMKKKGPVVVVMGEKEGKGEREEGVLTQGTEGADDVASPPSPSPPTLINTAASVGQLLLWLWVAAQSSASLFSQARAIAPRALFNLYGVLAALQLQGVTLDPSCFTSQPFLSFWVCLGATVLGLLLFLLTATIASTPWGETAGWVGSASKATLLLSATALTMTYGAIISVAADVLTCTLPTPLRLVDYVGAVSDGRALAALATPGGTPLPSLTALRAAAANPYLSTTNSQLFAFMQATSIPVSLQASNPFQVCKEGPHYAAWWAALALSLGFTLAFPALGWVSLVCATRARAAEAAAGGAKPTFLQRTMSHLSFHLSDSTFRPEAQWLLYAGQGGLALVTGLVGLSRRYGAGELSYFTAGQAGIVGVSIVLAVLTHRTRPFAPFHTWKHFIALALFGLTGITSAFNAILVNLPAASSASSSSSPSSSSSNTTRTVLGSVPLVCAMILGVVVVSSWMRNVMSDGVGEVVVLEPHANNTIAASTSSSSPGNGEKKGGVIMIDNPMATAAATAAAADFPPPPPQKDAIVWRAVRYPDGDLAWASTSTSTSSSTSTTTSFTPIPTQVVWELPPGAVTACGWRHDISNGQWVHEDSGVTSARAPPRIFQGCIDDDSVSSQQGGGEGVVGYWHCKDTQESLFTLPSTGPCETTCGWVAMGGRRRVWKHLPTGVECESPPLPPLPYRKNPGGEVGAVATATAAAAAATTTFSPLPPPPTPLTQHHQWERVVNKVTGTQYWHCPNTGESLPQLPSGAGTACGWVHVVGEVDGGGGEWVHLESGVKSRYPPSVDSREAEAYILAQFRDQVKGAWRAPFGEEEAEEGGGGGVNKKK